MCRKTISASIQIVDGLNQLPQLVKSNKTSTYNSKIYILISNKMDLSCSNRYILRLMRAEIFTYNIKKKKKQIILVLKKFENYSDCTGILQPQIQRSVQYRCSPSQEVAQCPCGSIQFFFGFVCKCTNSKALECETQIPKLFLQMNNLKTKGFQKNEQGRRGIERSPDYGHIGIVRTSVFETIECQSGLGRS